MHDNLSMLAYAQKTIGNNKNNFNCIKNAIVLKEMFIYQPHITIPP